MRGVHSDAIDVHNLRVSLLLHIVIDFIDASYSHLLDRTLVPSLAIIQVSTYVAVYRLQDNPPSPNYTTVASGGYLQNSCRPRTSRPLRQTATVRVPPSKNAKPIVSRL